MKDALIQIQCEFLSKYNTVHRRLLHILITVKIPTIFQKKRV